MTLLLREADVRALLPMSDAIRTVRDALTDFGHGAATNQPRRRVPTTGGFLNVMFASSPSLSSAGLKAYSAGRQGAQFIVALWDDNDGALLALIESDWLGRIRTGAASGVATDVLLDKAPKWRLSSAPGSRPKRSSRLCRGTPLEEVQSLQQNTSSCRAFAGEMETQFRPQRRRGRQCPRGCRRRGHRQHHHQRGSSGRRRPVAKRGRSCQRGRFELGTETGSRYGNCEPASTVVVDSIEQAREEAGDILIPIAERALSWDRVRELPTLLANAEWVGKPTETSHSSSHSDWP